MKDVANIGRIAVTLAATAAAGFVAYGLWDYYMNAPWTRDARVRADVAQIAPDVSGLVEEVVVRDNSAVRRGDVLFRVDRNRFQIAEKQAEAAVTGRQAGSEQAKRELARVQALKDFASRQQVEQAGATADQAEAALQQAVADLALAKLNLTRSEVTAPVNGIVSNLSLQPGDYVTTGKSVMALINTDSIRVEGYFEETKLPRVRVGDPVSIRLMGRSNMIYGNVESIAGGIEDRERTDSSSLLANVNPTFTWVRLAQRIPVRIKLDMSSFEGGLVVGQTATVEIEKPAAGER